MKNHMEHIDTSRLIAHCLSGDEISIERLVNQYRDGVFKLALSVLDDPAEANEAAQDAFIAALAALESYRDGSFKAWLYTITLNISRSRLRKRKTLEKLKQTLQSLFHVETQKSVSAEDALIQDEKDAVVWRAMEQLGPKHRIPIVLRYYHDLSTAEIADMMKINEGTVRSRLHIARERLRLELEKQAGFSGE
jgi:RNA polymerase sigma-70 factor (ECF subfamily)